MTLSHNLFLIAINMEQPPPSVTMSSMNNMVMCEPSIMPINSSAMASSSTHGHYDPSDTAAMMHASALACGIGTTQMMEPSMSQPDNSMQREPYAGPSNSDTNIQVADSNSPKQTFVPCKVCGDKASGYHYGVTSCEGCKGFFRRSIQKQIEYRCLRDGKCMVIRLNRNRCQYCRFKKCLAVGMSRDSVRYGRVPKRSKSLDEQRVSTTEGRMEQSELENRQLAIYDIILTISQAHHANCVLTEDKVKNILRKPVTLYVKQEGDDSVVYMKQEDGTSAAQTALNMRRLRMFESLSHLISPVIQRVVEFAKRVPGFHELSQDDQLILIKTGFFEIWLTRMTRMYNLQENTVTFGDGSVIARSQFDLVFTPELTESMFDYAHSFSQLHLNDTEVGLYTGVVLATLDRQGLSDTKAVERIQDKLIEALKLQISRNHSTEPHLFANILMKLPELRMLGSKHADELQWIRQNWVVLRLPPLFAEIYDIPKCEDEATT